ncbi:MAG: hypothetical protein JOZ17_21680 [Acetobacteraceae bacterium]|nr:hypothetical protein [Acetobacteraceae bacterium]MBV8614246.1 hypothetical protein [Acetobacteraceae bacterium]
MGGQVVHHEHRIGLGAAQRGQQHPFQARDVRGENNQFVGGVGGEQPAKPEKADDGHAARGDAQNEGSSFRPSESSTEGTEIALPASWSGDMATTDRRVH